jgi:hypothetical protein
VELDLDGVAVRRSIASALALAAFCSADPAAAQAPAPPCPPGVAPSATLSARDLIATHTIDLELETADGIFIDDFKLALPSGAKAVGGGPTPAFRADSPGPVSVTATWLEYDRNADAECTARVSATFVLAAPQPLKFVAPRPGKRGISELNWYLRVGKRADLRPVEVRLRGIPRARLPAASAPVQTITLGLREGDPGRMLTGTGRVLRSAGWRFRVGPFFRSEFPIRMTGPKKSRFGFDLQLVQGGRRIGRTRAVGRCEFTAVGPICRAKVLR